MTLSIDEKLCSFAKEIGWQESILTSDPDFVGEWAVKVDELRDVYGRPASWSSDAIATVQYEENGEKWLAEFKTFIDGQRIWRVYERVQVKPDRPTFCIARRSSENVWERMGYFSKWPRCWQLKAGANDLLREAKLISLEGSVG